MRADVRTHGEEETVKNTVQDDIKIMSHHGGVLYLYEILTFV